MLGHRLEAREPIEAWKLHVEEDDVRLHALQERQQIVAARDLTGEHDVLGFFEDERHRVPHQCVVLRKDHPNCAQLPPLPYAAVPRRRERPNASSAIAPPSAIPRARERGGLRFGAERQDHEMLLLLLLLILILAVGGGIFVSKLLFLLLLLLVLLFLFRGRF